MATDPINRPRAAELVDVIREKREMLVSAAFDKLGCPRTPDGEKLEVAKTSAELYARQSRMLNRLKTRFAL